MRALRVRLLIFLLSAVAVVALAVGGLTYHNVLLQSEALFDYQLEQMALSLRDQGSITLDEAHTLSNPNFDFVVQIWSIDGTLLYASRLHTGLPPRSVLGLADVDANGTRWRVYSAVSDNGLATHIIQVAQPQAIRQRLAADTALRGAFPLLVLAPLLAAAVWWTVSRAFRPLLRLADEVRQREALALEPLRSSDLPEEVAPLVHSLNGLLERLRRAVEAQRGFVANAAHELRSPLTALKVQLTLIERARDAQSQTTALGELRRGVDRASHLVEQLLVLARTDPSAPPRAHTKHDLSVLARAAVADAVALALSRSIDLELEAETAVTVEGDAEGLRVLVRNLVDNAVRYTPPGGRVRVSVAPDGPQAVLCVDDSGPGIPVSERERVFDRFYRRHEARSNQDGGAHARPGSGEGEGSGLGLAIVRGIADQHGATVALTDSALGGLRAVFSLPRAVEQA